MTIGRAGTLTVRIAIAPHDPSREREADNELTLQSEPWLSAATEPGLSYGWNWPPSYPCFPGERWAI